MAAQSLRAPAQPIPSRRRLADNVVCLYADDRPPVEQAGRRRGRYPACVTRINSVPRLRVGAICEIRPSKDDCNAGIFVRILGFLSDSDVLIQALFGREIIYKNGSSGARATITSSVLRRSLIGERHV